MSSARQGPQKGNGNPESQDNLRSQIDPALLVGHISSKQVMALMAFLLGVKAFLITPTFLIIDLSTAAWISALVSTAIGFLGLVGWLKWSNLTRGTELYSALKKTIGTVLATIVCGVTIGSFLISISLNIRIFAGGAAIALLPEVPIEVLLIILILSSAYAAWLGLENIARAATFFLAPTVISFLVVVFSSFRDLDTRNLLPLWGPGPETVALKGVALAGLWGILPAFTALKTYVRSEEDLAKGVRRGLVVAGLALAASTMAILLFFPYPSSTRLTHPLGIVARSVYLGRFLQRIEALFVFTWFFASALQASFMYFVLLVFIAQLSQTKSYRPYLPALVTTSFGIAAMPVSLLRAAQLLETHFFNTFGNAFIALGWVLYAVARFRGVRPESGADLKGGCGDHTELETVQQGK